MANTIFQNYLNTNQTILYIRGRLKVYDGFLNCLRWTKENMNNPKIIIGENGFPEDENVDNSEKKVAYHRVRSFRRFQNSFRL